MHKFYMRLFIYLMNENIYPVSIMMNDSFFPVWVQVFEENINLVPLILDPIVQTSVRSHT